MSIYEAQPSQGYGKTRSLRIPYFLSAVVSPTLIAISVGPFCLSALSNWDDRGGKGRFSGVTRMSVSFHIEFWPPAWGA